MQTIISNFKPFLNEDARKIFAYYFLHDRSQIEFDPENNEGYLLVSATSAFEDNSHQLPKPFELSTHSYIVIQQFAETSEVLQTVLDYVSKAFDEHVAIVKKNIENEYRQTVQWYIKDKGKLDAYIKTLFSNAFIGKQRMKE